MLNKIATIGRNKKIAASLSLALAAVFLDSPPAEARHWRSHHRHASAHAHSAPRYERSIRYHDASPRRAAHIAAIVVDGNSGETLYAQNENQQRFPASITKVMTLYLLFEQIEQGRLRLDSEIPISPYAASQKPTKLGLRPGQTITVEDAIKAVVTRSANDIAVAIAETIAGSEDNFARLMTQKAHALGMTSTHFANASGLPNPGQLTTARDLAVLGRAIQERFPRYYHYFATRTFYYHGAAIANHNHLLGRIEGMDGIKTGYTNASGFNLLTSVKRGGRYIVAVVLGGASARSRDQVMAGLIEEQIGNASAMRTASSAPENQLPPRMAEAQPRNGEDQRPQPRDGYEARPRPASPAEPAASASSIRVASLSSDVPPERPRPAFVPGAPKILLRVEQGEPKFKPAAQDGSTARKTAGLGAQAATATPASSPLTSPHPRGKPDAIAAVIEELPRHGTPKAAADERPPAARSGWMIQIGATNDVAKAAELLARARSEGPKTLIKAQAFTEKIKKGQETLYRARFAGLEEDSAALACKALKRSGFSCFATRD
jgi:D-alanyl-D-alanine carboxypeptidase